MVDFSVGNRVRDESSSMADILGFTLTSDLLSSIAVDDMEAALSDAAILKVSVKNYTRTNGHRKTHCMPDRKK